MATVRCLLLSIFLLVGCATNPRGSYEAQAARWQARAAQPTSPYWTPGAVWTFVDRDERTGRSQSWTFLVTARPAVTCVSGDWFALDLVEAVPALPNGTTDPFAWSAEGNNLTVALNPDWCDAYDDLIGGLDEARFAGRREQTGLLHFEDLGHIDGWRIR